MVTSVVAMQYVPGAREGSSCTYVAARAGSGCWCLSHCRSQLTFERRCTGPVQSHFTGTEGLTQTEGKIPAGVLRFKKQQLKLPRS